MFSGSRLATSNKKTECEKNSVFLSPTQWSGTARYGMVRFQKSLNAGLAPSFE